MNKIYQVIWSKTKHMYVVVSEIARRDGKAKSEVHIGGTFNREKSLFGKLSASACGVAMALALVLGAAPVSAEQVGGSNYWVDGSNAGVNGTTVDTTNVTYAIAIVNANIKVSHLGLKRS